MAEFGCRGLPEILVLKSEPEKGVCPFAFNGKFSADIRAVIFDSAVMDGKLRTNVFAGFALRD